MVQGPILEVNALENNTNLFHVGLPLKTGHSGGPLLNPLGKVVGMAFSQHDIETNFARAKDVPKDAPNEQFNLGKAYFDEEDYARAVDEFNKLIKHYPNSRWAAEGEFHKGVSYERMGDIGKAAESFKTLIDRYPYSDRLNDAVEHEFELAEAMLDGKKTKFLGMAIIPAEDTAADAYRHIVRSAPYGPYGAVAQYRLADAELVQGNFDEAERAYQAVIDEYPNSEYAPKAKYKIAQVSYKAALNEEHHLVKTEDALSKYASFKRAYPESYLQFEADDAIQALRQKKAQDIYDIAFFYQERKKYNSAKVYYNDVLGKFADTGVAEIAQQRMEEIDILEEGGSLPQRRILGVRRASPCVTSENRVTTSLAREISTS